MCAGFCEQIRGMEKELFDRSVQQTRFPAGAALYWSEGILSPMLHDAMMMTGSCLQVDWLKALRVTRALRPLRYLSHSGTLRKLLLAVRNSVRPVGEVLVLALFIYFIFGIMGMTFFMGLFYACNDFRCRFCLFPPEVFVSAWKARIHALGCTPTQTLILWYLVFGHALSAISTILSIVLALYSEW